MATLRQVAAILLALVIGVAAVRAASPAENRAFAAAVKFYDDGFWDHAETEFGRFAEKFPKAERRNEAVLFQAQARLKQGRLADAIKLLEAQQAGAGNLADQYLYVIGQAQFQNTNYPTAAEAFGKLAREFPDSARRLEAAVSEAAARGKLGEWPQVIELLEKADGAFQQAAAANPESEVTARGRLLLAEALLEQKNFSAAETALQPLAARVLKPELDWQKKFLLAQIQLGDGRPDTSLETSADLLTVAQAAGRNDLLAESFALRGDIFDRLGQRDNAIAIFKRNLTPDAPALRQRQALLKVTELLLAQDRAAEAITMLEEFVKQFPNSPAMDVALLTLGEIHLKQQVAPTQTNGVAGAAAATNHLSLAVALFDRLLNTCTNSPLAGRAELCKGWCFWVNHQMPESAAAFARAVARLPDSEDLAIGRFKLGDAQYEQRDFAAARENYRTALALFARWPRLNEGLRPPALYQLLRASEALTNLAGATEAMGQILQLPAAAGVADRSVLLVGQAHADAGEPEQARAEFGRFVALFPESGLRPQVELLIARTHEQQKDWAGAITNYDQWLERYETNSLRPRAEFQRAWANSQAGNETNALNLFTNFVAQSPNDALAPQAQWWVADYFYGRQQWVEAEKNYKLLFQNWPDAALAYEARMMAGRAAVERQGYKDAIECFTNLTSDLKCPPGLKAQAMFAYGDALMAWPPTGTNKLANFETAVTVFSKIQQTYPADEVAALASGEMAKCFKQLGDPNRAAAAFGQVITSRVARVSARSEAQAGLAMLQEEQAERLTNDEQREMLGKAQRNYLEVFNEINLGPGESPDLFWLKEAGLKAVRVTEALGQWEPMEKLCRRLATLLPQLQPAMEKKIAKAQEHLSPEKR